MTMVLAHRLMTLGVATPRVGVEWANRPSRYLTIDGVPAFQIGYSCGTCGLVLRHQPGAPAGTASSTVVRDQLNAGLDDLASDVIDAFSAQLLQGEYLVMLLDISPQLVYPGTADDYFAAEGPSAWQNEEVVYPIDPANVAYYRLGQSRVTEEDELFHFGVPMTDPSHPDQAAVAGYAASQGGHPTAVALGLLDIEGPWFRSARHWGLFHFLLDGHHKTMAASATGRSVRLLTFVSVGESLASEKELLQLPRLLQSDRKE